jgi:integrase
VKRIAPRTYVDAQGRYHARYPVNGRYTWRLLKETTKREAIAAAQAATTPARGDSLPAIVKLWIAAGCITKKQKWRPPGENFIYESKLHAARLVEYFGNQHIDAVNDLFRCAEYQAWAGKKFGTRAADKGAQTLSNLINYALFRLRVVKLNFVRSNRDNIHRVQSPSRNRMPESADVIHKLADYFLSGSAKDGRSLRSEVFAWLTLFQMFTGCRTSELLRLRLDAETGGSGYISAGQLHLGHRSKGGIDPWVNIGPEFAQMIDCFKRWHKARFPKFQPYFCGPFGTVLDDTAHVHALTRACNKLKLPHITPHGLRAYYVTKRRRDGANDNVVAGEIGDTTVSLIAVTYGRNTGGTKLSWLPSKGLPAWQLWQPEQNKIARIA